MSASVTSQLNGQCYLLIYLKKTQQLDVSFPKRKSFKLFFFGFKVQLNPQKLQPCILTSDFIVLHLYSTEKQKSQAIQKYSRKKLKMRYKTNLQIIYFGLH